MGEFVEMVGMMHILAFSLAKSLSKPYISFAREVKEREYTWLWH